MPTTSSLGFQFRSFPRPARLFLVAVLIDGIVFSAWSLFFNFYILERGFSREFLGLVTTTASAAALLLGIPLGMLSDRIGRRWAMLLGAAGYVLAAALQVTVTHPALILGLAFVGGGANALYFLSHAPFMMKVSTPENRTLLFSLSFGLVTLSGAIGNLFSGQLPAFFGNLLQVSPDSAQAYQAVLLGAVALGSLTLFPLYLIREPGTARPGMALPQRPLLRQILTRPATLRLVFPNLLIGLGAAILIPYMNVFFRERFLLTDGALGALFSLSSLITGVGSILAPRLTGVLGGKIRAVVFTQGLSLLFLLSIGFTPFAWIAGIGFLARGALMNMAVPLYDAFAMEITVENEQGTVNSLRNLAWQLGWTVGPYLSGVVQETHGFTPLFIATAVMYALSIALTWAFFRNGERRPVTGDMLESVSCD